MVISKIIQKEKEIDMTKYEKPISSMNILEESKWRWFGWFRK